MHIIALENEPTSLRGGQHFNLLEICCALSQRGHSTSLLYTKEGNLLKYYYQFCSYTVKVDKYAITKKVDIFNLVSEVLKINRNIPNIKNSIVFSNQYQDSLLGSMLAFSKNIPFVCYLQQPPPKEFPGQWNIGLKGVKQLIAVSNQTKFDWVKSGFKEEKIDVVYNGTNLKIFKPSRDFFGIRKEWDIPKNTRVISYVGRLDKEKGLETLIKAFALLLKSSANARLLIAGKPVLQGEEYKSSLEQMSIDLGIEKYVSFLGHVDNTTSVYQVSDVTVLPCLWSEPFGRTIIESMACGTPVVASRTGGIPENLTGEFQSGLFEPGNEQALSDTLNQFMNWRDKDPHLGERCREHVLGKFTLDKMVDGIEKSLLRVVKQ